MKNASKFSSVSRLSFVVSRFLTLSLSVSLSVFASAQKANYNITVTLNDKDKSLDGFLTVDYTNNSSDSVHFLWFNIYPNAFKSDRTAFSEYMLNKGRTDFYFANPSERGYINRLDFRSGDNILKIEDHPQYIDIVKVIFEQPLAPGDEKKITTPFHVKLPYNFDGIGYSDGQYDLRYWYPAVANFVKPFTSADSSSNLVADYMLKFTLKKRFTLNSPLPHESSTIENADSLKTITITASSVKDIPLSVVKPQTKNITKSSASEHDMFRFLKKKNRESNPSSKVDTPGFRYIPPPATIAFGYNEYDGFQLAFLAHDLSKYSLLKNKLGFYIAPAYAFRSKSLVGLAGVSYKLLPEKEDTNSSSMGGLSAQSGRQVEVGLTASSFSYNDGVNANQKKVFAKLIKVVPFIKLTLPSRFSSLEKTLTFKTYLLRERNLEYTRDSGSPVFHQREGKFATRYINELSFDYSSSRVLYPYHAQLQAQQSNNWYRLNATGNYFFNYPKGGGMNVRLFAAKFGYIGSVSTAEKFENLRYMPKLTAVRGGEDYTYSNYFIGRNNFDGFASRQIMMRDGGLKLRTDLFEGLQGRSDDWVASVNLNTSIPLLPSAVPLKIFFDAGTYSEAWDDNNPNPRFLYVAGLQLSLFKDLLNIYAPVFYSKPFRDQLKSVPEEDKFFRKVSFSIDIQKIDLKKLL